MKHASIINIGKTVIRLLSIVFVLFVVNSTTSAAFYQNTGKGDERIIKGRITDEVSGASLTGASISIKGEGRGVSSDENGTCTDCKGSGTFQGCNVCRNQGSQKCNRCSGSGDDGRGTPGCETCLSEGKISCSSCQSAGANYVGKCIRCNGGGKTTFKECDNCESGKSSPKIQILGMCVLCEGNGRVEIPAS